MRPHSRIILSTFICTLFLLPVPVQARLFRQATVCLPKVAPNGIGLAFTIRESGPCPEPAQVMQVQQDNSGVIYLLRPTPGLSADEEKDVENYRKFYGES